MAKHTRIKTSAASWKLKWPRNGDLRAWLLAAIRKCEAIPDDRAAEQRACLPIRSLGEMGFATDAIRHVNRFLRRLPMENVLATVSMAELGAELCLAVDNQAEMERFLAIVEATEPFNKRKCDKGFSVNSAREFRASNGLLDPDHAIDEKQRTEAGFERARRRFKLAMAARKRKQAIAAIAEMEAIADQAANSAFKEWYGSSYIQVVLDCHVELKDAQAIAQSVRRLSEHHREQVLHAELLNRLGMGNEAVERSRRDIIENLEELRGATGLLVVHPVTYICRSLTLLVELGERDEARRWLLRLTQQLLPQPGTPYGWPSATVFCSLAKAAALIDGPAAADKFLDQAKGQANAGSRVNFRQGAVSEFLDLMASIGRVDEAIEYAEKLRSPTERRASLATLLARAKRWKDLQKVLSQVESPEEAADLAWQVACCIYQP